MYPQYNAYSDGDFLWEFPYLYTWLHILFLEIINTCWCIRFRNEILKKKNLHIPRCMQLVNCKIGKFTLLMLWLLLQGLSAHPEKLIKGLSQTMVLPSCRQTWVPDEKQDVFTQFPEQRFRYPLCQNLSRGPKLSGGVSSFPVSPKSRKIKINK